MMLLRTLRRFAAAKRGVAAIEFAILAPMMVFLMFASVDLLNMLETNKRVQNVAASVADVVARDTEVSNSEISGLWSAIGVLMYPDNGSGVNIRITSVRINSATDARVVWSEGRGMSARTNNSQVASFLPSQMRVAGTSVIIAETTYGYRTPLGFLMSGPVTMSHNAFRRSRLVDPIPRVS